jgi:hypothetical protein
MGDRTALDELYDASYRRLVVQMFAICGDLAKAVQVGADFHFSGPPGYPGTGVLWLVQWLDDDTVVLHAKHQDGIDLLECHISTGECAIALQVSSDAVVPEIG